MKMMIYAVLDAKIGNFGTPFFDIRDESAIRSFSDAVNDGSNALNQWHKHPEDFALYRIGEYDNSTAEIIPVGSLRCLVTASALKAVGGQMELFPKNGIEKELVS